MKRIKSQTAIFTVFLLAMTTAFGQLPALNDRPFLGHFIGVLNRKQQFGITAQGRGVLNPLKRDGSPVNIFMAHNIDFIVQETRPDGSTVNRRIDIGSLTSDQSASLNPEEITFTGKVTSDASFQVTLTSDRNTIGLTGKILDPGKITNPLNFFIQVAVPTPYKYDDKESKAFERKMKNDDIRLVVADNKRLRVKLDEKVDGNATYPDPIKSAELNITSYQGARITYSTSEKSHLMLTNRRKSPLYDGFMFHWAPEEGANPDEEKLIIEIR